ncbi:methyltransferase family protein [Roseospira visakhapatnamensis]|uniref:Protein-S-isoprenylcysteine O-methyltransferase Ste14 n=1 Tax=Roseospira visakhapatnamensis TaxID=390880 RepID=A0A7W6W824_9PROT|nr:methyltransferase [Roseospira visakhapatnamensis]MBB4264545.1 protein-S-isoprenylcysteine O-methyltransferase Ste14 [Roseospira visakhapatnamensis]
MDWVPHLAYAALWASFGLGHSLFAGRAMKARMAALGRWYRLTYNAMAAVHLAVVVAGGVWLLGDRPPFAPPWPLTAAQGVLALAGLLLLAWASRFYDMGRLAGLRQIRDPDAPESEPLRLDGPHRFLRHPFYAAGLMLFWGLAQSPLGLATALWGSLYFLIGSRVEERRLLALYGGAYADYRRRIPGFIPAPLLGRRPLPPA